MINVSETIKFDNPNDLRIVRYVDEYEVFDKSGNSVYYHVDEHNTPTENVVKDILFYLNGKL